MKEDRQTSKSERPSDLMDSELHVHGFSCIRDIKIRFRKMTVLIGEQASGKSITCKLFYYFTHAVRKVALASLYADKSFDAFLKDARHEFISIFPETAWKNDTFVIDWTSSGCQIKVWHKRDQKKLHIEMPDVMKGYEELLPFVQTGPKQESTIEVDYRSYEARMKFEQIVERRVGELLTNVWVDYIPAGRSFFSTIQDVLFTLLANNIGIDYFLKEFGQKLESYRYAYRRRPDASAFEALQSEILHGKYFYDGKEQWIITDEKHKVRLSEASSGQQEALPLLMVLAGGIHGRVQSRKTVVVEEPEAHLYPTAQKSIVEFIGGRLLDNLMLGCVVTTHSPFILCCINNLLNRHDVLRKSIAAYHLHDGTADSIFDDGIGLIDAVRFDEVSSQIANER